MFKNEIKGNQFTALVLKFLQILFCAVLIIMVASKISSCLPKNDMEK